MPSLRLTGEKMKKYRITDKLTADFLEMYCDGKCWLWRLFFGWRGSHFENEKWVYSIYYVPMKVAIRAELLARKYGGEFSIAN